MNVLDKSAIRECTSCQICAALCTHNAISIILNKDGFYRPIIDSNLCTECGLCTRFCYKFDENIKLTTKEQLDKTPFYAAWSNNDELVKNTTSGGIGDLLACQLQKMGYKVVGCVYNEEKIRAEHRIATTETELILFRGSKYIQSYTFDVLKTIVANCREEKYAIFGTPCQIYALNKWVTKKGIRDNFFFVDLYCHGCPSLHIWIKYQQYIKNKLHVNKFDQVIFRSKVRGWGMFYVVVVVVDGRPVFKSTPKEDGFYELFFSDQLLNDACNRCVLRRTHEYTDIRLGDFWGKKFLNNQRGVSAVSIVSERGVRLFDTIKKMDVFSTSCTYSDFLPYQSWGKVYNPNIDVRKALLGILESPNQTITDAVKELYRFQSIRQKVIRYIKYILAFFPLRVTNTIKKVL